MTHDDSAKTPGRPRQRLGLPPRVVLRAGWLRVRSRPIAERLRENSAEALAAYFVPLVSGLDDVRSHGLSSPHDEGPNRLHFSVAFNDGHDGCQGLLLRPVSGAETAHALGGQRTEALPAPWRVARRR